MMRIKLIIFFLLLIVACKRTTLPDENERVIIIEEVRQTLKDYYADVKKSGLMAEFNYLDNSNEFFWVPPGYSSAISYDSVASVLKQSASKYRSIINSFDTLKIIPLSNELATYSGRLNSVMIDTSGKTMTFSLVETGVFVKRKEGWKLLHGQTAVINE